MNYWEQTRFKSILFHPLGKRVFLKSSGPPGRPIYKKDCPSGSPLFYVIILRGSLSPLCRNEAWYIRSFYKSLSHARFQVRPLV